MIAFHNQRRPYTLGASGNRSMLIVMASGQQLPVKRGKIFRLRYRHPVIPSEVANLSLNPAFLMSFRRIAKLAFKPPMRSKRNEPPSLFPLTSAENLFTAEVRLS